MADSEDKKVANPNVSRRSVLKWSGALAAAGVIGIGLGFGGDILLRPSTTSTKTSTTTGPTTTVTAPGTTSTVTTTSPATTVTQTQTETATQTSAQETLLTSSWDAGPFLAHVVNGVWTKSSPLEPNIPGATTLFLPRNRVMSPDRIRYPMQRVDFSTSNRNTQNRGKSQYVRISWDEAFTLVASELQRVKSTYGNSAMIQSGTGHSWPQTFNGGSHWQARFFNMFGGASTMVGDTSATGAMPAANVTFGSASYGSLVPTNNAYDILKNSKLVIFWGCDPTWKNYSTLRQNLMFQQWKEAGIKMIVVDIYHNDTAALYADQYIAPIEGTDEAMLAAIAYVWINKGTYNKDFVSTHVYGFQQFSDYITGSSDGTPKTPQWAAAICGVDATTITNLANDWASQPTFLYGEYPEGAQRRDFAAQHSRMEIALCAMQGFGIPGQGFGGDFSVATTVVAEGLPRFGGVPGVANPVTQIIRHNNLAQAILTGSASWTTAERHPYKCEQESYPLPGNSKIHLIAWASGSGSSAGINQRQDINTKIQAVQDPSIEFTFSNNAWWESTAKFSDVILPVATVGEVDDMVTWQEYAVYQHSLMAPVGEAMSDFAIYAGIAQKLGFDQQLTQGMTSDQWLQQVYAAAKLSMTYDQFKQTGYVKYPIDTTPQVTSSWAAFYADPVKNALGTKSGLIEIYSQAISAFYGDNTPNAPPIPKYIPGPENLLNAATYAGGKYPLLLHSAHAKFARHSQWQNVTWLRDEPQMYTSGYKTMLINPEDATAYGLKTGDVVHVFNDRGQILAGAHVSEEQQPKTVWVSEGGWYTPQQPGVVNSIDLGGNVECLISGRQPEPLCDGMINSALVQIEKWNGGV